MQKDTEEKILDAAKEIFSQKGFDGARMQEIADKADINKAMLHYYFRSKQQLFERIVESHIQLITPKLVEAISDSGTVIENLERLVDIYIDTIIENPSMPMFLLNELSQRRVDAFKQMKKVLEREKAIAKLFQKMKEEQKRGVLKEIPPHHLLLSVMSLIVFPFIAWPVFQHLIEIPEEQYNSMMLERKPIVKDFIRSAITK
ncbi:MAG: TetR/AcrR family transcriptional regulator [Bacteroidota bacterium]